MTYLLYIFFYGLFSYSLFRIAKRLDAVHAWLAFVPFVQMWIPVCIAEKSSKWFLLLFIPIVNVVALWVVWGKVAEQLGRSAWWGRMMLIPLFNILILPLLAFDIYPNLILKVWAGKMAQRVLQIEDKGHGCSKF